MADNESDATHSKKKLANNASQFEKVLDSLTDSLWALMLRDGDAFAFKNNVLGNLKA